MLPQTHYYLSDLRDRLSRERATWEWVQLCQNFIAPYQALMDYQHTERVKDFLESISYEPRPRPEIGKGEPT